MADAKPNLAETILRRAIDLHTEGRSGEAIDGYRRALGVDPTQAGAARLLGMAEAQKGRLPRAARWLRRSIRLDPFNAIGWARLSMTTLAAATGNRADLAPALTAARRALSLSPGGGDPCAAMGALWYRLANYEGAVIWNLRAHRLTPANPDFLRALGAGLRDARLFDAAETVYGAILDRAPSDTEARLGRAVTRLVRGDLSGGFEDFDARWKRPAPPPWKGEAIDGRDILLHAEQGFGDTLQFARYAPLVADRGGRVTLEVHPALVRLLSRMDPRVRVVSDGGSLSDHDLHCPLMSLPRAFGTTLDTIPGPAPGLIAPPPSGDPTRPLTVGLVWAGNPGHRNDHNRSIPPELLTPLRSLPGVTLVSLQTDMGGEAPPPTLPWLDELARPLTGASDFADTAEVVAGLDLVITVDTAMAHLAGTIGRPCWTLIPRAPDWRWLIDRSDTPWYPAMRIFRQSRGGDWTPVVAAVAIALDRAAATRQEAARPGP